MAWSFNHRLTKEEQKKFRRQLKAASAEKDVEIAYKDLIQLAFDSTGTEFNWSSPHNTDGVFSEIVGSNLFNTQKNDAIFYKNYAVIKLLLETKYKKDFRITTAQFQTLLQAIYYLKEFENNNEILPNVVLIGDENECFVVAGSSLEKYLSAQLDWKIPASKAGTDPANQSFILKLINTSGITPYVFEVSSSDLDLNTVIQCIASYAQGLPLIKLKVNEKNIRQCYEWFINSVFRWTIKKYQPDDLVSIFIQSLTAAPDCYLVPPAHQALHLVGNRTIPIDANAYIAFFSRFEKDYTSSEKREITAIADRLIEETKRRFHGDFWTPTIWADKAQEVLERQFGSDYRENFVVWDCCCGSKNLTRDYAFKELYLSTLHQSELDLSKVYNPKACTFQMDFLNDDLNISPNTKDYELSKTPPHYLKF